VSRYFSLTLFIFALGYLCFRLNFLRLASIFLKCSREKLLHVKHIWGFSLKQRCDFYLEYAQYKLGRNAFDDPLFKISWRKNFSSAGKSNVFLQYYGLDIRGSLQASLKTQVLELKVDGHCIKKIELKAGRKAYLFRLKRSVLSTLPREFRLTVQIDHLTLAEYLIENPNSEGGFFVEGVKVLEVNKKDFLVDEKLPLAQQEYLRIYEKAARFFNEQLQKPLFILYGTLLGLVREQDYIPGDDDFDVGFYSDFSSPEEILDELLVVIEALIGHGFIVHFNRRGKLFRLKLEDSPEDMHLDVRAVWHFNGYSWLHKHARLKLAREDFLPPINGKFRGVDVYLPHRPEKFLEAYYGSSWRVPDPTYSNDTKTISKNVLNYINQTAITPKHYEEACAQMAIRLKLTTAEVKKRFVSIGSVDLYPLEQAIGPW
jgi:hypothetical protein